MSKPSILSGQQTGRLALFLEGVCFMATEDTTIIKRRWGLGLVLLIFLSVIVAFISPLAALPFGTALIAGGIVAYRQSEVLVVRAVAIAAIVAGASIILIVVGVLVFLAPVRGSIFSSVSTPIPMPPP
jgi:hypothetical protein